MFASFFFAGFECATGYNAHGEWIDQVAATHHDLHADEDYGRLRAAGIRAAREAIRWPLVDRGGRYDFASVEPFVAAAAHHGIEVIWDLFHYGFPDDLDLFAPQFADRFAAYCEACARFICARVPGRACFTPMNEPSYFAWAAGEVGRFAPWQRGRGAELKLQLVAAAIRGIDAIRAVCPQARMVNVDPLCRVVPPRRRSDLADQAAAFNDGAVFEAWDTLCGRLHPELGGSRRHLDIVGINYYWTNQWELGRLDELPLAEDDPRRVPLRELVDRVWQRYGGELLITETSHLGDRRPAWIRELVEEAEALLDRGIPLRGVCLYPILSMPEWHARQQWAQLGLWDLAHQRASMRRELCAPMMDELRQGAERIDRRARAIAEAQAPTLD